MKKVHLAPRLFLDQFMENVIQQGTKHGHELQTLDETRISHSSSSASLIHMSMTYDTSPSKMRLPHSPCMTGVWMARWIEARHHESWGRGLAEAPDTPQHPAVPSYCSLPPPEASGRTGCPQGWSCSSARHSARQPESNTQ